MKRIIWGLIKILIIIGLLAWVSHKFFPKTLSEEVIVEDVIIEDITEPVTVTEEVLQQIEILTHSAEPITTQQKRYVTYSKKAGIPAVFTGELILQGTNPVSIQLAQAFGESVENWPNLEIHKKTFWILSELTLQKINVDNTRSLHGAKISVKNGLISIDMSEVSPLSTITQFTPASSVAHFIVPSLNIEKVTSQLPAKKAFRRMSARSWQQVLEVETGRRSLQKRKILRKSIPGL
jgi:hypothetical protein